MGKRLIFGLLLVLLFAGASATAQTITLQLSPPDVNFDLNPGSRTNVADNPITLSVSWQGLKKGQSSWLLFAYFDGPVALRPTDPTNTFTIPASAISGAVSGDTSAPAQSFTTTASCNGTPYCLAIDNDSKVTGHADAGTRNDLLSLSIDLSGALAALPPDTYTGIMHVKMMAY